MNNDSVNLPILYNRYTQDNCWISFENFISYRFIQLQESLVQNPLMMYNINYRNVFKFRSDKIRFGNLVTNKFTDFEKNIYINPQLIAKDDTLSKFIHMYSELYDTTDINYPLLLQLFVSDVITTPFIKC